MGGPLRRSYFGWNRYDKTNVNPFGTPSQMSIFDISTDNRSMYHIMYQVMYVEKSFPTLISSVTSESVFVFRRGRSSFDEIGDTRKLAALSNNGPPNERGAEIET